MARVSGQFVSQHTEAAMWQHSGSRGTMVG